jgi:hypothetical protein
MENEELFAGESALDAQQHAKNTRRTADALKHAPLQVHTEPLLADEFDDEPPHYEEDSRDIDTGPRWRRPHVSDSEYLYTALLIG